MALKVTAITRQFSYQGIELNDIKEAKLNDIPRYYSGIYTGIENCKVVLDRIENSIEYYNIVEVDSPVMKTVSGAAGSARTRIAEEDPERSKIKSYKSTDSFMATIQKYLSERAANDELFAKTMKKTSKNIEDCTTYILNRVKDSGKNGFDDSEIYGMAVHYYDEDDIKVGSKVNNVIVKHSK